MTLKNFDIAIIGSSYAGMTSALSLARISPDLKIAIIEKENVFEQARKADGRAYAISATSLKLFKKIGIYDDLSEVAGKISDIKITDYESSFILDFIGSEVDQENNQLGAIIENHHIFEALKKQILHCKNITIFCPNFYQEIIFSDDENEGVKIKLAKKDLDKNFDEDFIEAKLLLACDGRFSRLREAYQVPTIQKNYQQVAIVFKIAHEISHQNIAYEKFLPGGPLAILPLKNSQESSIVLIVPSQESEGFLSLDDENFLQQLDKKMEGCLGKIEVISQKFSYPLVMIEAEKFYYKKMLLVGDAACGVHPIAGQGFNLAISGIEILVDLIKNNLLCGLDIAETNLINSYNKKAKFVAKKMVIATDILNSVFESKSLTLGLIRDLGLGLVNKSSRLKKFFIKSAGGF